MRAILLLPALSFVLSAQAPIALEAPIQRVRLHPDEAWVTRTGKLHLAHAGTHRLQIAGLPAGLRVEDLQASAKGTAGLRLGDISVTSDVRVVTETPEWKKLEAEKDALREKRDALEAQGEAVQQELTFLKNLEAAHDKELSSRLAYATPNPGSILELGKGLQARMAELLTLERKRKRDLEKLSKEEARVAAEMRLRSSERRTAPSRVTIELTSPAEAEATVELSYRTRSARWRPLYEARLSEDRKKLDLVLSAAVTQSSGETWDGVRLEISNARPSRDLAIPVYEGGAQVGWERPSSSIAEAKAELANRQVSLAGLSSNYSAQVMTRELASPPPPPPPSQEALESTATMIEEASGLAATFLIDGLKDVPSDNEPHRFKVIVKSVEPTLTVFATPRLDPTAFLMARFKAPANLPLFPSAPVVRFSGNQRLGEAPLSIPTSGQPFALGFGPYKSVRVSFRRVDHKLEQVGTFSKERQWTVQERIEVDSDGAEPIDMEIQDRMLKPAEDQVKITLLPAFASNWTEPLPGVRAWAFKLAPKEHKVLEMPFTLKAPKDGTLTGVEDLGLPMD